MPATCLVPPMGRNRDASICAVCFARSLSLCSMRSSGSWRAERNSAIRSTVRSPSSCQAAIGVFGVELGLSVLHEIQMHHFSLPSPVILEHGQHGVRHGVSRPYTILIATLPPMPYTAPNYRVCNGRLRDWVSRSPDSLDASKGSLVLDRVWLRAGPRVTRSERITSTGRQKQCQCESGCISSSICFSA